MMLSLAGGGAGVVVARWGTALLVHVISTQRTPVFLDLALNWRMMAFTAAVVILTSLVFGMLPALRSTRVPLAGVTRGTSATAQGQPAVGTRTWIVAAQIALSLTLLVTAGLCLRTFGSLVRLELGFDKHNVLLVAANLQSTTIGVPHHLETFDAIESRLAALPGVVAAGRSHITPLGGGGWNDEVHTDSPLAPTGEPESRMNFISPGYFAAMRMALRKGREFTKADAGAAPWVVIVSDSFARKFYGSIDPIGHVIRIPKTTGELGPPIQIVGVVADATYLSLREPKHATAFFPITQIPQPELEDTFALRTSGPPETLVAAAEAAVAAVNPEIPLTFATLEQRVDDAMVTERLLAMLSAFFGAMALLLATIGLYGTISYRVALRRSEFGIRKALGAPAESIVRLVVSDVVRILVFGAATGLGIAMLTTSALKKLLFGVEPRDVTAMAGAAVALGIVVLAAGYLPARRAARVEPMTALRCD
jgi:predicted permease